jgi:hypothetical protein
MEAAVLSQSYSPFVPLFITNAAGQNKTVAERLG